MSRSIPITLKVSADTLKYIKLAEYLYGKPRSEILNSLVVHELVPWVKREFDRIAREEAARKDTDVQA